MEIIQNHSPNYTAGRQGKKIIAIVNHITAGSFPGCMSWLCNPSAKVSAHYLVTQEGAIYQLVADENTAWHAGIANSPSWSLYDGTNPNRYTIGIEHENLGGGNLTETQYQSTLWLHRQLISAHGITPDSEHIIGHYRIDTVNRSGCPGKYFPWTRLFNELNEANYPAVNINVGGQVLQGYIVSIDGKSRSCAPVAALAGALGKEVQWDAGTKTVLIPPYTGAAYEATSYVKIAVGSELIPAIIINNRSYAPVAAVGLALGKQVTWDAVSNTVTVI